MAKLLNVIKAVETILNDDATLTTRVENKIYPVAIPAVNENDVEINFPCIVMTRSSISPTSIKICDQDIVSVQVDVYAEDYPVGVEIAEIVRDLMENARGEINGVNINLIRMSGASESVTGSAYAQSLIFDIK